MIVSTPYAFRKIGLFVLLVAIGVIGFSVFQSQQKKSDKKQSVDKSHPNSDVHLNAFSAHHTQREQGIRRQKNSKDALRVAKTISKKHATEKAQEPDPEKFMSRLRDGMWISDPETALRLAEEGEHRFVGTPLAAECAWIAVRSLVELGNHEEGRAKSKEMVEAYPQSRWTMDVKRHMLSHPPGM